MSIIFIASSKLPTKHGDFLIHAFEESDSGQEEQRGVILYLRQEGRGIGLVNKVRAYALQDKGADTVEANEQLGFAPDLREYSMCEDMLKHLGIHQVRLMTNNPLKVAALEQHGIDVVERVPLMTGRNPHNDQYLDTKEEKMGHLF